MKFEFIEIKVKNCEISLMKSQLILIFIQILTTLFSSYGLASPTPIQTRIQSRASSNAQLVTAQSLKGTTSEIPNYRKYNIDPSKTTLSVGGVDYTSKADVKVNPNNPDILSINLTLNQALKAQPNLEIKLSGTTKDGIPFETKTVAGVAAKFAVAPIHVIKIPSYDSVLEDATIKTPVSVFEHGAVNILYQEGDKLENFIVNVPVFALDEKGMPVSVDVSNLSLSGLSSGVTSGSTTMTAGLAVVPLTITSSNPDTLKLEVSTVSVDGGTRSAARVTTRNPLVLVIPVIVVTAEELFLATVALTAAAKELFFPSPPQEIYADWVGTKRDFSDLSSPITQFPPPIGGSCAPRPFSFPIPVNAQGNITQAPYSESPELTESDLMPRPKALPCQGSTWTPPDGQKLEDLIDEVSNSPTLAAGRIASEFLANILASSVFKPTTKWGAPRNMNGIQGLNAQINESKLNNLPFIREFETAKTEAKNALAANKPYPPNAGATQHANSLRQYLNSIKSKLRNRGEAITGKGQPDTRCYSDADLDFLFALYKAINRILKKFDNWGGF
jgi:hypothetical protein